MVDEPYQIAQAPSLSSASQGTLTTSPRAQRSCRSQRAACVPLLEIDRKLAAHMAWNRRAWNEEVDDLRAHTSTTDIALTKRQAGIFANGCLGEAVVRRAVRAKDFFGKRTVAYEKGGAPPSCRSTTGKATHARPIVRVQPSTRKAVVLRLRVLPSAHVPERAGRQAIRTRPGSIALQ